MPKTLAVNKNFFKNWSAGMAYVLGFFSADGCLTVNPRGSHYVEFVSTDEDILQKIRLVLESEHKIRRREYSHKGWKDLYRLQIGSKEMFNDLVRLGFTVNKSKTIRLPEVPERHFADYLRGYFDGDGCINYGRYRYKDRRSSKYHIIFRLTSASKDFLTALSGSIVALVGTKGKTLFASGDAYNLAYSTRDSLRILEYIYKTPTICMNRKLEASNGAIAGYHKFMDW